MTIITGLGDPAVTIAIATILFAAFLFASNAVAWRWLRVVLVCGLVTAAFKTALYAYGHPIPAIWLASPSGHVAASVLVYGVLSLVVAPERRRALAIGVAALAVSLIAISRVYLQAHTESDVIAGVAIGGACLAWFLPIRAGLSAWPIRTAVIVCIVVSLTGAALEWQLPVDPFLRAVAAHVVISKAG